MNKQNLNRQHLCQALKHPTANSSIILNYIFPSNIQLFQPSITTIRNIGFISPFRVGYHNTCIYFHDNLQRFWLPSEIITDGTLNFGKFRIPKHHVKGLIFRSYPFKQYASKYKKGYRNMEKEVVWFRHAFQHYPKWLVQFIKQCIWREYKYQYKQPWSLLQNN